MWNMLFFLTINWFIISFNVSTVDAIPNISSLCPYNDFCTTKATKIKKPEETNLFPCCQKCSCEDGCQHFGNCCPDKILKPGVDIKYSCVDLGKYLNKPRGLAAYNGLVYRMVDDCPSAVLSSLYPKCFIVEDLEDYVVVSDPITDRVYKNKHCALCNGVKEYTEWKLISNCKSTFDEPTASRSEIYSYIGNNCSLTPWPHRLTDGLSFACKPAARVETCNSTGIWKQQDDAIQKACETENQYVNNVVYKELRGFIISFENAYCELCNSRKDESLPTLCDLESVFGFRRGLSGISVLINIVKEDDVDAHRTERSCNQRQLWDPYHKKCIDFSCPPLTIFRRDIHECEDIFIALPGNSYAIVFDITANIDSYVWVEEDVAIIDRGITKLIQNRDCFKCGTYMMKHDISSPDIYITYTIKIQDTCTQQFLVKKVQNIVQHSPEIIYKANTTTFSSTPNLVFSPLNASKSIPLHIYSSRYCPKVKYIDREMVYNCPRIVLPEEYQFNITSNNSLTLRDGTICVAEYFKILKSIHNSQVKHFPDYIVLTSLMTLYMLYM